jgi:hypothetical protein
MLLVNKRASTIKKIRQFVFDDIQGTETNMKQKEFEKNLDLLLAGDLSDDQLSALEDYASRDAGAVAELDRVKKLQAMLHRNGRHYRRESYPGDMAVEVFENINAKTTRSIFTRRFSYALAVVLVVISSLLMIHIIKQPERSTFTVYPSLSVMADINRDLNEFRIANSRHLTHWSMMINLGLPNPAELQITGLRMPYRPAMIGNPRTISNH